MSGWARLARLAVAVLAFAALAAPARARDVTVFAAASLKTVLDEAAAGYRRATGVRVVVTYAGSPTLAKQIEAGAPADLFVSADLDWMDHLEAKDLIQAATRRDLAGNSIVLVTRAGSGAGPLDLSRDALAPLLVGSGRLAVANVEAVPAGRYAKAALTSLGRWEEVRDRLAQAENVRAALALVARGEVPLGVVYATDAGAEPGVSVLYRFPEGSHPAILYPAALVADAGPQAMGFLQWLSSPEVRPLFERHGFSPPAVP